MLVKNNETHIFRVMTPEGKDVGLVPGVNDIPDADWGEVEDHPLVKARIDNGQLETITKKQAKDAPMGAGGPVHSANPSLGVDNAGYTRLSDYDDKDAVKIVKETVDLDTLRRWQGQDSSQKVAHAIQGQIDKVLGQQEGEK